MPNDETNLPDRKQEALDHYEFLRPGKLKIRATKPMTTTRDLSRAYSPGVAKAFPRIEKTPSDFFRYTARSNLVAVVLNGTAVLGRGNIGATAPKPVAECKAVQFKKLANVDCFGIKVDEADPESLAEIVAAAGLLNAVMIAGKNIQDLRLVALGAGAACLRMLQSLGVQSEEITMLDSKGVVYVSRNDRTADKKEFARVTDLRAIAESLQGADALPGVVGPGPLAAEMVTSMAATSIIFVLSNPVPEIMPELAREAAKDALIVTGLSEYPNQINNVPCFRFIFRGTPDAGTTGIIEAISQLASEATSAEMGEIYRGERPSFGPVYLIPNPLNPRLFPTVALAVANAATESGVSTHKLDLAECHGHLQGRVCRSHAIMRRVFDAARASRRNIVFAEGEDECVLRAA